jgi:hypothetical protein
MSRSSSSCVTSRAAARSPKPRGSSDFQLGTSTLFQGKPRSMPRDQLFPAIFAGSRSPRRLIFPKKCKSSSIFSDFHPKRFSLRLKRFMRNHARLLKLHRKGIAIGSPRDLLRRAPTVASSPLRGPRDLLMCAERLYLDLSALMSMQRSPYARGAFERRTGSVVVVLAISLRARSV